MLRCDMVSGLVSIISCEIGKNFTKTESWADRAVHFPFLHHFGGT